MKLNSSASLSTTILICAVRAPATSGELLLCIHGGRVVNEIHHRQSPGNLRPTELSPVCPYLSPVLCPRLLSRIGNMESASCKERGKKDSHQSNLAVPHPCLLPVSCPRYLSHIGNMESASCRERGKKDSHQSNLPAR
jgi:hypothetical protein